jgi:hypothetical protein
VFDLFEELRALTAAFDADGLPYALCGGLAVGLHGLPRATRDIDFLVPGGEVERAKRLAASKGFVLPAEPMLFPRSGVEVHRVSKPAPHDLLTVDFILVNAGSAEAFAQRQRLAIEDGQVWTVSREGLIDMKRAAGRPQDLADIERLLEET